ITPPYKLSTVSDEVLGYFMAAFFGGRAECRVRREIVPVTYVDVRSMYATVFSLLSLSRFLTAAEIGCEDATEDTQALLEAIQLDDLFAPEIWRQFVTVVELEPDADILPVRTTHGGTARSIGIDIFTD